MTPLPCLGVCLVMTFKTLQECDNFSTRLARNMRKSVKTERDKEDAKKLIGIWLGKYQCVATGDPRLNEKWCVAEIQIIACGYSAQCTVGGGRTRATRAGRYTDGQAGR